jgi:hypothetical protein
VRWEKKYILDEERDGWGPGIISGSWISWGWSLQQLLTDYFPWEICARILLVSACVSARTEGGWDGDLVGASACTGDV